MARTHSLNVTVVVPAPLRSAVEGRAQVLLGLPATAGLGDALQTLLQLYPRLGRALADERPTGGPHWLHLGLDERATRLLAEGSGGLYDGQTLFLFCAQRPWREEKPGTGG